MKIFTIGYSGKTEAKFFEILRGARVKLLIDVRRFRTFKFIPFASEKNLAVKCKHKYVVIEQVAPSASPLSDWQKGKVAWSYYKNSWCVSCF